MARLRDLENSSEAVEIGGRSLVPGIEGTVDVVARSHVEFRGRDDSEWIVPLTEIDVVIAVSRSLASSSTTSIGTWLG